LIISFTDVSLVSKKVPIGGGMVFAIFLINSSVIGPGPLGILATRPIAEAPYPIAVFASSSVAYTTYFNSGNHMSQFDRTLLII
jgi:hypothetical protein